VRRSFVVWAQGCVLISVIFSQFQESREDYESISRIWPNSGASSARVPLPRGKPAKYRESDMYRGIDPFCEKLGHAEGAITCARPVCQWAARLDFLISESRMDRVCRTSAIFARYQRWVSTNKIDILFLSISLTESTINSPGSNIILESVRTKRLMDKYSRGL